MKSPCALKLCTDWACLHSQSQLAGGWEAWEGDAGGEGLFVQHEGGPCLLLGGQQPTTGLCAECDVCEEGW